MHLTNEERDDIQNKRDGEVIYACDEDPVTGRSKPIRINVFPIETMRKHHILMTYSLLGALSLFTFLSICYDFYSIVVASSSPQSKIAVPTVPATFNLPASVFPIYCNNGCYIPPQPHQELHSGHVIEVSLSNPIQETGKNMNGNISPSIWNTYYRLVGSFFVC